MSEETYMGGPRSRINWCPEIDQDKCDLCNGEPQCLKFCPHNVYAVEGNPPKLIVKNPENCVVFCRSCRTVCPTDALNFRKKSDVLAEIQKLRSEIKEEDKK